jgi:hypothetical protein
MDVNGTYGHALACRPVRLAEKLLLKVLFADLLREKTIICWLKKSTASKCFCFSQTTNQRLQCDM